MVYDLIIVGGGPAGITAGIYAARQKLNTLLIAKSFGGQMNRKAVAIENYPGFERISGMELIKRFEKHLRKFKIDIERDSVTKIKRVSKNFFVFTKNKHKFQTKAVIVASGADPRLLGIPGEKKFIGRGVSYCVQCDGPLFSDKVVAVIGGGNAGFETAIALSKWVQKIYILEYTSKLSADVENQEIARKTGKVEIITNVVLKQIKGKNFVDSIIYQECPPRPLHVKGGAEFQCPNRNDSEFYRKSKKINTLKVEGVFVEIGSIPATNFVKGLVDFNKKGEIKINSKTCMTKTSGIFAAGDVTEVEEKQIVIAAGQGAKAALSAYKYLR